ncbi:tetratricopeptide repeat protein [Corallococcus macrosporus]|uniref:Tetratricopeptide repeat protein n=1 Tax=Corallococcus macrosporus TaxID=35 RepID=A0ABS3D3K5_9BACT|nr:tetratricopeptide repeat protein [Corallococcus macrosporus]MBN8226218.1 tetratricopeptide repeat protein [Corallococcus macrosporus]
MTAPDVQEAPRAEAGPGPLPPAPRSQAALVALLALGVFAGTLLNGFVYDDQQLVLENPWIRSLAGMREPFRQSLFGFLESSTAQDARSHYYRPLMHVFLFVLRQAAGPTAWVHHLALMLGHAAVSVGVLWLLRTCLVRGRPAAQGAAGDWAALGGALLFALHPVHTEAVAWVSGAMDVGMTLLLLVAARLWLPVPATAGRALLASGVWLAALLVKETAFVLPVLLWSLERVVASAEARGGWGPWLRRQALLGVGGAVYLGLRLSALEGALPGTPPVDGVSRVGGVLAFTADLGGKLAWPAPLAVLSPGGPVHSLLEPRVWLGGLLLLSALVLSARAWRRGPAAAGMGWVWLGAPMVPAFVLQARGVDAYAERYLYLPSVGFALLVTVALRSALSRFPERARPLALVSGGVLAVFAALTLAYVPAWRDDLSLWTWVQARVVDQPLIHLKLGDLHLGAGRLDAAIPELELAARGLPGDFRVHNNLAVAYAKSGRMGDARRALERTARLMPDNPVAWHNLGLVSRREGDWDTAIARFRDALRLAPDRVDSLLELGRTLLRAGRAGEAIAPLEEALRLRPDLVAARKALAEARAAASPPPR